jgi:uncharacterized protein YyaL (SSP411 family)
MPNRLRNETSPYLLQHADNPVNWYPWGDEALRRAREEEKPIFLSIGYSACHWCHVMARESFEDPEAAATLNEHFVSVKVDREERPDLDQIYMGAVQAMTGGGGWPMSVFLTPEGLPFYAGTYFPPTPRYGLPSFQQVLQAIVRGWRDRRPELIASSRQVLAVLRQQQGAIGSRVEETLRSSTLTMAVGRLQESFDADHGGWGAAPKFPQPMALEFLLRYHHRTGEAAALAMVTQTLEAMARGGMYDQIGGGFHRYSVDEHWATPHFERMLYDNAQLSRVYLHGWQVTGNPFFRTVAEEVLDYVAREMTSPGGGFYSTQDADSEGKEGEFFLWAPAQIRAVLGKDAERFIAAYGISEAGNFEGRNILTLIGSIAERDALAAARRMLFAARERRVHPGRDDKVLTSWNGLMLAAFAEAARALGREDYRRVAENNAGFLLRELRGEDGRLWHVGSGEGASGKVYGYLEDHTHLIEGLLELYQTTFDPRWYAAAQELAEAMIARFRHREGGFYDTPSDHEALVVRPRELQDNATPSGNGMAAHVLPLLAGLAAEPRYWELAEEAVLPLQPLLAEHPLGFGQWLIALDYLLASPREVAIVGDAGADGIQELLQAARAGYRPHQVVAVGVGAAERAAIPLLQERDPVAGRATAYVCVDSTCRPPVSHAHALRPLLDGTWRSIPQQI